MCFQRLHALHKDNRLTQKAMAMTSLQGLLYNTIKRYY